MQKIRIKWACSAIKKFLSVYLPQIELGELKEFKCKSRRLGDYVVVTSKGTYELSFSEHLENGQIFKLWLDNSYLQDITFSIYGFFKFKIWPETMSIEKGDLLEVINLQKGTARLYVLGKRANKVTFKYIEFKRPFWDSKLINIYKVLKVTKSKYEFR